MNYKTFFNYDVGENVLIRDDNHFDCDFLNIEENVSIHSGNRILGGANFSIGKNSRIINNHYIDLYNNVIIGSNTWLAGINSQICTHGLIKTKLNKNLDVIIGNSVYPGSNVSISPGVNIVDTNLIGGGKRSKSKF